MEYLLNYSDHLKKKRWDAGDKMENLNTLVKNLAQGELDHTLYELEQVRSRLFLTLTLMVHKLRSDTGDEVKDLLDDVCLNIEQIRHKIGEAKGILDNVCDSIKATMNGQPTSSEKP